MNYRFAAGVPDRAGGVDELLSERLHPPIHRHVIHCDATLADQLLDVAVGQPVARSAGTSAPRLR